MAERREHTRFTASSLSYIDLGEANGGLILNLSEGGVSVQAAEVLAGDVYPRIRFHLPKSEDWIDTGGRIVWRGKTKKEAGIRFVDMPPYTRRKIREWLAFEEHRDESQMTWQTVQPAQKGWTFGAPIDAPAEFPPELPPVVAPNPEPQTALGTAAQFPAMQFPDVAATVPMPVPAMSVPAMPVSAAPVVVAVAPVAVPRTRARRWKQIPEASSAPALRIFDVGDRGQEAERRSEPHRWVLMTVVTCVVGALCFIAGMSVRTRNVPIPPAQVFSSVQNRPGASLASTSPLAPAAAQITPPGNPIRQSAAAASPGIAGIGANPPGAGVAGSAANPSTGNPSVHPGIMPMPAGGNRDATVLLNLEEVAVGASAFVAITTRLSVMVPPNFRADEAQENNYLHAGDLVYMVEPAYPPDALRDRIEGTAEVVARFSRDGTVERVDPYSGPGILSAASIVAVRQWRYAPTYLYGRAIETIQRVKIVFRLP
jgi:hypothetical protein